MLVVKKKINFLISLDKNTIFSIDKVAYTYCKINSYQEKKILTNNTN